MQSDAPKYIRQIYKLVLEQGYRPRQDPIDIIRGELTGMWRITLKRKKRPVLAYHLFHGRGGRVGATTGESRR